MEITMAENEAIPNTEIRNTKNYRNEEVQSRPFQDSLSKPQVDSRPTYGSNVGRAIDTGGFAGDLLGVGIRAGQFYQQYDEGPDITPYLNNRKELQDAIATGQISPARGSALRKVMRDNALAAYGNNPKALNKIFNVEKLAGLGSENVVNEYEQRVNKLASDYYSLTGQALNTQSEPDLLKAEKFISDKKAQMLNATLAQLQAQQLSAEEKVSDTTYNQALFKIVDSAVPLLQTELEKISGYVQRGEEVPAEVMNNLFLGVSRSKADFAKAAAGRTHLPAYASGMSLMDNTIKFANSWAGLNEDQRKRELESLTYQSTISLLGDIDSTNAAYINTIQGLPLPVKLKAASVWASSYRNMNPQAKGQSAIAALEAANKSQDSGFFANTLAKLAGSVDFHPEVMDYYVNVGKQNERLFLESLNKMNSEDRSALFNNIQNNIVTMEKELLRKGGVLTKQAGGDTEVRNTVDIFILNDGIKVQPRAGVWPSQRVTQYCTDVEKTINNRLYLWAAANSLDKNSIDISKLMNTQLLEELKNDVSKLGVVNDRRKGK